MTPETSAMAPKGFKLIANALNLDENTGVDFAQDVSDDNVIINEDSDQSYLKKLRMKTKRQLVAAWLLVVKKTTKNNVKKVHSK